ncbi:MAG: hypothetical protein BWZ01_00997 [Deltaproteobacteria bacterium ADurb.BinA179]|jgi:hypothetical protein|nr:hypothetical protein [Deltaproteobacteria bacterium]MDI9542105.1 hypothetical protein [Pseudomonadota bacterium]NLW66337.1 hypothetical protein [Bacteriovoracaceae bacterium]OPZ28713.1 MAG: hypothetical protein BWZ01_00997 [Deltaproteobacteria bacterium ADurb.BinA179]HOD71875.1 hypothetical protein [Deltaproteobacteria bacterium]
MSNTMLKGLIWAVFLAVCLSACGSETSGEDSGGNGDIGLHSFTGDVRSCTPYLGSSSLDQWSDWDPDSAGSVLGKLFNPSDGKDECLYTHFVTLDDHIEMVNRFRGHWDENGVHTMDGVTATVDTDVTSVIIPYLGQYFFGGMSVAVDRMITLESGSLTICMAFAIDGGLETVVERYEIGDAVAGVFYAVRDGDYRGVWQASVRDARTQFMWEGDTVEKWFRLSQCTDTEGNWEVMGGGSVADEGAMMAFMARNHANSASEDEYYLTISLQDLMNGSMPDAGIFDAGANPPDGSAEQAYITPGGSECFGFLGLFEYPNDVDELSWLN